MRYVQSCTGERGGPSDGQGGEQWICVSYGDTLYTNWGAVLLPLPLFKRK